MIDELYTEKEKNLGSSEEKNVSNLKEGTKM
jgi:hypothetical protein